MSRAAATVALAAVLCVALGFVLGRSWSPGDSRSSTWLTQVKQELGLRPDQLARLDRLLAEQDRDLEQLVQEHRLQLREPVANRLAQTENELLAVLDDDQRSRYQQLVQN